MQSSSLPEAKDPMAVLHTFLDGAPKKPLIVIIGPTASGKTDVSISIANEITRSFHRTAEVVNADSRQLYRFLDIGTAKVTAEEMQDIPHHLFSVKDPREECSIAWYQREAHRIIAEIHGRGNIPLLVGGSMLYVSSVIDGLRPLPAPDKTLRATLEKEYDEDAGASLYAELQSIDPESAASIDRRNKVYLVRAIEIFRITGKPKSTLLSKSASPFDLLMLGVLPTTDHRALVEKRTRSMFERGWIDEVRGLIDRGYSVKDPGIQATGYRAVMECVQQGSDPVDLIDSIVAETMQYAKRQMTWWKRDGRIVWVMGLWGPVRTFA